MSMKVQQDLIDKGLAWSHVDTVLLLEIIRQPHPTVRSLAKAVGRTHSTVHGRLVVLQEQGLIAGGPGSGKQGAIHTDLRVVANG